MLLVVEELSACPSAEGILSASLSAEGISVATPSFAPSGESSGFVGVSMIPLTLSRTRVKPLPCFLERQRKFPGMNLWGRMHGIWRANSLAKLQAKTAQNLAATCGVERGLAARRDRFFGNHIDRPMTSMLAHETRGRLKSQRRAMG